MKTLMIFELLGTGTGMTEPIRKFWERPVVHRNASFHNYYGILVYAPQPIHLYTEAQKPQKNCWPEIFYA